MAFMAGNFYDHPQGMGGDTCIRTVMPAHRNRISAVTSSVSSVWLHKMKIAGHMGSQQHWWLDMKESKNCGLPHAMGDCAMHWVSQAKPVPP